MNVYSIKQSFRPVTVKDRCWPQQDQATDLCVELVTSGVDTNRAFLNRNTIRSDTTPESAASLPGSTVKLLTMKYVANGLQIQILQGKNHKTMHSGPVAVAPS